MKAIYILNLKYNYQIFKDKIVINNNKIRLTVGGIQVEMHLKWRNKDD